MAIKSDAQRRAVAKYNADNYARIEVRVYRDEKARLQDHAKSLGYSVSGYINQAVAEKMERDGAVPIRALVEKGAADGEV